MLERRPLSKPEYTGDLECRRTVTVVPSREGPSCATLWAQARRSGLPSRWETETPTCRSWIHPVLVTGTVCLFENSHNSVFWGAFFSAGHTRDLQIAPPPFLWWEAPVHGRATAQSPVRENVFLSCGCAPDFSGPVEVDRSEALASSLLLIHSSSKQNKKKTAVGDEMSGLTWNLKYAFLYK